ncbi:MAG: hypothetical protein EXX96DRAFT_575625 [Benjaminiella poitrasii]|nr:MAG: hypothetical protein EXX96DRAFT_575625 [Benjaminiella poitrasii]
MGGERREENTILDRRRSCCIFRNIINIKTFWITIIFSFSFIHFVSNIMFQFLNDWKRRRSNNHATSSKSIPSPQHEQEEEEEEESSTTSNVTTTTTDSMLIRTTSMDSDSKSFASISNWSIDWNQPKNTFTFKEDYVSFPSLEPVASSKVTCSSN